MKKIIFYVVSLLFLSTCLVFAQIPASQDTIVIPGGAGNVGSIENTINGDVLAGAVRINPNRVYLLQANTIYYVKAPIEFGGVKDSTSTLNLIGQTGGTLPVIQEVPANGGNAFTDQIDGNFTVKNVYWEAKCITNGSSADLFEINRIGRRLILENVVTEFGGDNLFTFSGGGSKTYLYNCYFRDMNWFQNSWNSCVVTYNGADTMWVENCSMTNTGLGFFLLSTVKFAYFNHCTFVNATKYGITKIQYLKGYFVNNVFVNMNWEGECSGTFYVEDDPHVWKGVTDIDSCTVPKEAALLQTEQGFVPNQDSVKFLTSNNIHFTDTLLNQYYRGQFTPGYSYPVSSRNWAPWAVDSTAGNIRVQNIPPIFLSSFTINLAKAYKNIQIDWNTIYDGVDPKMHTPGIATQAKLQEMVKFSQANYGVAPKGQTYDPSQFTFGDYNPTTIPGYKTENGNGIKQISDLRENFSYDANITSTIDGLKLGALHWWANGLAGWNSHAEFEAVEAYYNHLTIGGIK
jgi:hypothetical protein